MQVQYLSLLAGAGSGQRTCHRISGKIKWKDRTNKPLDAVQNISDAFGGILSKMIGGIGYTGSAFLQMGTKWKLQLIDFLIKKGDIINSIAGWRGHFTAMGKLWKSLPQDLWQNLIAVLLPEFLQQLVIHVGGEFMDKDNRRIIRVKEVILNIFITVILASFGIWLIGGITYNAFQKEQIHQRILALEKRHMIQNLWRHMMYLIFN